jgi:hypothetical protein
LSHIIVADIAADAAGTQATISKVGRPLGLNLAGNDQKGEKGGENQTNQGLY